MIFYINFLLIFLSLNLYYFRLHSFSVRYFFIVVSLLSLPNINLFGSWMFYLFFIFLTVFIGFHITLIFDNSLNCDCVISAHSPTGLCLAIMVDVEGRIMAVFLSTLRRPLSFLCWPLTSNHCVLVCVIW